MTVNSYKVTAVDKDRTQYPTQSILTTQVFDNSSSEPNGETWGQPSTSDNWDIYIRAAPDGKGLEVAWNGTLEDPCITDFALYGSSQSGVFSGQPLDTNASDCYYKDESVDLTKPYYYEIVADYNKVQGGSAQAFITGSYTPAPAAFGAPSLRAVMSGTDQIGLWWQNLADRETGFTIERSTSSDFSTDPQYFTVGADAYQYTDSALENAVSDYWYRIQATAAGGEATEWSEGVEVERGPLAPSQLQARVTDDNTTGIQLAWQDNSTPANPAESFYVFRTTSASGSPNQVATVSAGSTVWPDTDVQPGQMYWYEVKAHNDGGDSVACGPINVAMPNPPATITAYRTGENFGTEVSAADLKAGDPFNYLLLADDVYTLDPQGRQNNVDYNNARIDGGNKIQVGTDGAGKPYNANLAKIILKRINLPASQQSGLSVTLQVSGAGMSARLFDDQGNLLTREDDATRKAQGLRPSQLHDAYFTYEFSAPSGPPSGSKCSALAGVLAGDITLYVEGLTADRDMTITYGYSGTGYTSQTTVHMAVVDVTYIGAAGVATTVVVTRGRWDFRARRWD